jgi:hypothetical protein
VPHPHASTSRSPRRSSARLRRLAAAAAATGGLLAAGPLAGTASAVPAPTDAKQVSSFTFGVLPDTQFYSRYAAPGEGNQFAKFGTNPFESQTSWLTKHAKELDIPFVAHLGDVVDRVNKPEEWVVADNAMKTLESAGLPYSILAGNHDVRDTSRYDDQYDLGNEPYRATFPASRAAKQTGTYGGSDPTGFNTWHTFTAEGRQFLVLALSWKASDATLAWANKVIKDHPTMPVILTTHQLIDIQSDGETPKETDYGLRLWDKLIRGNDQIFLTFNGHYHGASRLTKKNDFGHDVHEVVIDYQMAYQGGNGYLGLYEFDFTNKRINAEGISPWVPTKPKELLTAFDQAVLKGKHQQYDIPFDFDERFKGFNADFSKAAPQPDGTSRTERAKQLVLDGYTEPEAGTKTPPQTPEDYPKVEGTRVHWRVGAPKDGTVVAPGEGIRDISGRGNDLTRAALNVDGVQGAAAGDVRLTTDHAPQSADQGAICFAGADRRTNRMSYLQTAKEAPLNDETFSNGYTIETFMKVSADYTNDKNQWMGALIRGGQRADVPGVPTNAGVEMEAGPFVMAFSNLRELQWSVLGSTRGAGDTTNWSGELMPDKWMHVAAVNDPKTKTTTLYVDGAPVLRNAINALGIAAIEDLPWIMGAASWEGKPADGFNGCLGETRMVDRPLPASQWLTARVLPVPTPGDGGGTPGTPGTPDPVGLPGPVDTPGPIATPSTPPAQTPAPTTLVSVDGSGPRVRGTARVGRTLRAENGRWTVTSGVAFQYQWLRDGRAIAGANAATYRVVAADAGHRVSVRVIAAAGGQTASAEAGTGARVARLRPTVAVKARVVGRGRLALTFRVQAAGVSRPDGRMAVTVDGRTVRRALAVKDGVARVTVSGVRAGKHRVGVRFAGTDAIAPRSGSVTLRVR